MGVDELITYTLSECEPLNYYITKRLVKKLKQYNDLHCIIIWFICDTLFQGIATLDERAVF